jgi:hypothetical protein
MSSSVLLEFSLKELFTCKGILLLDPEEGNTGIHGLQGGAWMEVSSSEIGCFMSWILALLLSKRQLSWCVFI